MDWPKRVPLRHEHPAHELPTKGMHQPDQLPLYRKRSTCPSTIHIWTTKYDEIRAHPRPCPATDDGAYVVESCRKDSSPRPDKIHIHSARVRHEEMCYLKKRKREKFLAILREDYQRRPPPVEQHSIIMSAITLLFLDEQLLVTGNVNVGTYSGWCGALNPHNALPLCFKVEASDHVHLTAH